MEGTGIKYRRGLRATIVLGTIVTPLHADALMDLHPLWVPDAITFTEAGQISITRKPCASRKHVLAGRR